MIIIFVSMISATNVLADYGTHLNVTMREVVYQETSFAENFTLSEWQKSCYSEGTINISNPENETVYDIYLSFTNTGGLSTNFTWDPSTKFGNQTSGTPGSTYVVHIPELRQGNYTVFRYNISCMGQDPQVNIETTYTNTDHGFNAKVLAGYNWTILQNIRNGNTLGLNITNVNISIYTSNVTWNDSYFNFTFAGLNHINDWTNVTEIDTHHWWWTPGGGTIENGTFYNITYNVSAPISVPFTATYQAIKEVISYEVDYLLSNLTILDINGSARIDQKLEKRIIQPSDNLDNHNVTWELTPDITVPVNITFDLQKVTMWVTLDMNPTNKTNGTQWGLLEVNHTGSPLAKINMTNSWGGASYKWLFNYTDGSNSSNPPPIVWLKPDFLIAHKGAQIVNSTTTVNGNDIYLKYIYVINGYWLEVSKNITNIDEDMYRVDVNVMNIGNGWTPQYTYVTVYDFVPNEFDIWNMTQGGCPSSSCAQLSIGSSGDDFYGTSYRWNIPWKPNYNASLGPKNGPNPVSVSNYSWNVSYLVNGTGPYKVSELYIVGLDPLKVDGAFTSPIITIISSLQSHTNEIIYVAVIFFLIIINITNLIMTSRIHNKIEEKLPPAPPPSHGPY